MCHRSRCRRCRNQNQDNLLRWTTVPHLLASFSRFLSWLFRISGGPALSSRRITDPARERGLPGRIRNPSGLLPLEIQLSLYLFLPSISLHIFPPYFPPIVVSLLNSLTSFSLGKVQMLIYDYDMMNVSFSPHRRAKLLSSAVLSAGLLAILALTWALFYRPELADQIIALFAIVLTLALIFYDPLIAFLIWLFFIPFAPFFHFNIYMPAGIPDLSYTRMVGSFLAIYLFAQIALGKRKFLTLTFFDLTIPLFVIPLLWSAIRGYSGWLWGLQTVFDSFLMPLLVYFIARQLVRSPDDFRTMAKIFSAIAVIIAVAAIVEQSTGFAPFSTIVNPRIYSGNIRKVSSFQGNPAYVALVLAVVAPLTLMLAVQGTRLKNKLGYGLALLVLEGGIIATFNRSGIAGGLIGPLVFSFLNRRLLKVMVPVLLVVGLIVGVGWGLIQDTSVAGRLGSESPIDYRVTALEYGLQIHETSPYIGVGWAWFGRLAADKGFRDNGINVLPSTHNSYLNFLVSGGYLLLGGYLIMIAGLLLTLLVAGWPRRNGRRFSSIFIQVALASYFAYFIPIAAFDNVFSIYANILFFAIMGSAISTTLGASPLTESSLISVQTGE